jgi:hypothetical protein
LREQASLIQIKYQYNLNTCLAEATLSKYGVGIARGRFCAGLAKRVRCVGAMEKALLASDQKIVQQQWSYQHA